MTSAKQEADGGARLHEAVTALTGHIREYVADHEHAVQSLAIAMADPRLTAAERQHVVDEYHNIYPGFITVFVADDRGLVNQIYPAREGESPPVSDREYFAEAMQTGRMAVSDVILGRLSHVPIVTIAVPILVGGKAAGVAGGSLDLSQFERFIADFTTLADARVSVLDQLDRVIYTNATGGVTALQSLSRDALVVGSRSAPNSVFRYQRAGTGSASRFTSSSTQHQGPFVCS